MQKVGASLFEHLCYDTRKELEIKQESFVDKHISLTGFPKFIKRGKWIVVFLWCIIAVLTFPSVSKLSNHLNDNTTLPARYQSQIVQNILNKAPNISSPPSTLFVVYENQQGLSVHNKQVIDTQRSKIISISKQMKSIADVSGVTYSSDGRAAYYNMGANNPNVVPPVRRIAVSSGTLATATAGQVAMDYDSVGSNNNDSNSKIDTILLISAAVIVTVLLLITYRSALLWLLPLISSGFAIVLAEGVIYELTKHGLQVSSLDSSILIVLVFGATTDYAMLVVSRYREELHTHKDKNEAAALAARGSFEAILASASTVALALLSLILAVFSGIKGLGPVAAIGIVCAFLVQMTFLPAMLAIGGRVLLWPRAPKYVANDLNREFRGSHFWSAVGRLVQRHPVRVVIGVVVLLLVCATGLTQLTFSRSPATNIKGSPSSIIGQSILDQHFNAVPISPLIVTANNITEIQNAKRIALSDSGTGSVGSITTIAGHPSISVVPKATAYTKAAYSYILALRSKYSQAGLHTVNVGGEQAGDYDYSKLVLHDEAVVMPVILLIVCVILALLLRAIVAPILLLLTVVSSFAGSFGLSVFIFQHILHFHGMDPSIPLFIFLFVVALGVDYNIFLMDRARQESVKRGTREGTLHALRVTGGVITAAGLVLAGTFSALAQIPSSQLIEVGIAVALGVLIDSVLVRSLLVPASVQLLGARTWWPSGLSKKES